MVTQQQVLDNISERISKARSMYPPFTSKHEGFAVILEEMDELWDEVKGKSMSSDAMLDEALDVAAMAVCFILEV